MIEIPDRAGWRITRVRPPAAEPLGDLDAAIAAALVSPVAGPGLTDVTRAAVAAASRGQRPIATIVVTDATRDCPDDRLVPPLIGEIEAGGIRPGDITVLVATGLHRPSTRDEKRAKLGPGIAGRYRVLDHDARDPGTIVTLGEAPHGVPITTNRLALESDVLVATGIVEPHQYAGFSGGHKTVAIGIAGEATIAATHAPAFIELPGVALASLAGNPFHEVVTAIGRRVGTQFAIDLVADADNRPIEVAAGEPEAVHARLVHVARRIATVAVERQADVAIAGVPASKAVNLYQASRAITYLHFGPRPAVRRGGVYVVPAELPEGAGLGVGERRFHAALREAATPAELVARLRAGGARAGEQRAWMLARVLAEASVVVAGAADPAVPRAAGLHAEPTLEAALELAAELARRSLEPAERDRDLELLVVADAIRTLPIVGG